MARVVVEGKKHPEWCRIFVANFSKQITDVNTLKKTHKLQNI